jgi:hypothetical protein
MTRDDRLRLHGALQATNVKDPPREALQELRVLLREFPQAWKFAGDLHTELRNDMLESFRGAPSVIESVKVGFQRMEESLRQPTDGPLEAMLVDQVMICWLDDQIVRSRYARKAESIQSIEVMDLWQRKLTATQQRYLRAVESLARVRRLMRFTVQVNIAQPGSQVVNVAGDMQTGGK